MSREQKFAVRSLSLRGGFFEYEKVGFRRTERVFGDYPLPFRMGNGKI
jgi:hypothetical protein